MLFLALTNGFKGIQLLRMFSCATLIERKIGLDHEYKWFNGPGLMVAASYVVSQQKFVKESMKATDNYV